MLGKLLHIPKFYLSIFLTRFIPFGLKGLLEPVPATVGWRRGTHWTCRQSVKCKKCTAKKKKENHFSFFLCFFFSRCVSASKQNNKVDNEDCCDWSECVWERGLQGAEEGRPHHCWSFHHPWQGRQGWPAGWETCLFLVSTSSCWPWLTHIHDGAAIFMRQT